MNKGFTLIELMIIVAIVGILAAIFVPAYHNYACRRDGGKTEIINDQHVCTKSGSTTNKSLTIER